MTGASPWIEEGALAIQDIEFWRCLAPDLTVSAEFLPDTEGPPDWDESVIERLFSTMKKYGYWVTPPILDAEESGKLLQAIDSVCAVGLDPTWALLYDEFWSVLSRLRPLLNRLFGGGCSYVTGCYVLIVEPGEQEMGWGPHRDSPDRVSETSEGMPFIMAQWIALTDATPDNSCVYCLPVNRDPNYPDNQACFDVPKAEDVVCLPVSRGQVIGLSHSLLHWGARSSDLAKQRRVCIALDVQDSAEPCVYEAMHDATHSFSFEQRAAFIGHVMLFSLPHNVPVEPRDLAMAEFFVRQYGHTLNFRDFEAFQHQYFPTREQKNGEQGDEQ